MDSLLGIIVSHFDWRKDFEDRSSNRLVAMGQTLLGLYRPLVRGGVIGGIIGMAGGAAYSAVTGTDLPPDALLATGLIGAAGGFTVDGLVYLIRYELSEYSHFN